MAQLSRPYQIGLIAVALLAAAWLLLVQGHSSNSSTTGSTAAVSSPAATAAGPSSTSSSGHLANPSGATAPGISGLTRAVQKAQGAVATSEANAKNLKHNSEAASSPTGTSSQPSTPAPVTSTGSHPSSTSTSHPAATAAAPTKHPKAAAPSTTTTKHQTAPTVTKSAPSTAKVSTGKPATKPAVPGAATRSTVDRRQLAVEAQLHKGKIVLILFWDQKGTDDRLVHGAVQEVARSGLNVAVETATPHEVASFGSITRGVQVYGTPAVLVVNAKGHVSMLVGLQDSYGIRQAVSEARHS